MARWFDNSESRSDSEVSQFHIQLEDAGDGDALPSGGYHSSDRGGLDFLVSGGRQEP